MPGDPAGKPGHVELLDRSTNRRVPADYSGSAGRLHRAWDQLHSPVEKTQTLMPGAHTGSGAEDSGHNFEDQTGQRDALERPSTGRKVGGVAHDGTARLAALRHPTPACREVQDFQGSEV